MFNWTRYLLSENPSILQVAGSSELSLRLLYWQICRDRNGLWKFELGPNEKVAIRLSS